MGRPKTSNKKKSVSLSINIELDKILDELIIEKNVSKSQYIEFLVKKEMETII